MTYHDHEPDDRRQRIARAIVDGNDQAEALYETSTTFRAWVDTLAHIVPVWAEGAALRAERADADANRRRAALAAFGDPDEILAAFGRTTPGGAP